MRRWWGHFGVVGPLLGLCGVALLLIAAQQRSAMSATVVPVTEVTSISVPAATPAPLITTEVATPAAGVQDGLVRAATVPTATPVVAASPPSRLSIPSIGLNQPIVEVQSQAETIAGEAVQVWNVADYAVGHHDTSADPGQQGNVVLAGHDDWHGEVFRNLHSVQQGAEILVTTQDGSVHRYLVTQILLPQLAGDSLSEQLKIGELIEPTTDERLTLVTCWPYGVDDHRLIVIARPET